MVMDIKAFDLSKIVALEPTFLEQDPADHQHDKSVTSVGFKFKGNMSQGLLEDWLGKLMKTKGTDLFRYKGVLAIKGMDRKFVFQGVHMLFGGTFAEETWTVPEGERENLFCFIGKNLDRASLTENFMGCVVDDKPLRFDVGAVVRCRRANGWEKGEVIKHWDEGNAYRVRLHDKKSTEIWAPWDGDEVIRLDGAAAGKAAKVSKTADASAASSASAAASDE
jgi:hypothetical protein